MGSLKSFEPQHGDVILDIRGKWPYQRNGPVVKAMYWGVVVYKAYSEHDENRSATVFCDSHGIALTRLLCHRVRKRIFYLDGLKSMAGKSVPIWRLLKNRAMFDRKNIYFYRWLETFHTTHHIFPTNGCIDFFIRYIL